MLPGVLWLFQVKFSHILIVFLLCVISIQIYVWLWYVTCSQVKLMQLRPLEIDK